MPTPLEDQPRSAKTLVERLGRRVAAIRGRVHGAVGTHAYRVWLVTKVWPGGEPGRGQATSKRTELFCGKDRQGRLVPPSVLDAEGIRQKYRFDQSGIVEEGEILVEEISDVGMIEAGLADFARLAESEGSVFEIQQDGRDGTDPPVRTYALNGSPQHDVQGCQWIVRLRPLQGFSQPFSKGGAL